MSSVRTELNTSSYPPPNDIQGWPDSIWLTSAHNLRMLASVETKQGPQSSNPDEVVVIMFGVELRAVDKAHRHL